jgi:hypothetical protein
LAAAGFGSTAAGARGEVGTLVAGRVPAGRRGGLLAVQPVGGQPQSFGVAEPLLAGDDCLGDLAGAAKRRPFIARVDEDSDGRRTAGRGLDWVGVLHASWAGGVRRYHAVRGHSDVDRRAFPEAQPPLRCAGGVVPHVSRVG